jgi:tripartite-type tricarboxylate transporter receptor subunit TctC
VYHPRFDGKITPSSSGTEDGSWQRSNVPRQRLWLEVFRSARTSLCRYIPLGGRLRPMRRCRGIRARRAARLLYRVTIALALLAFSCPVHSQAPRTIKIVVPFPPGGGSDLLGRILADYVRRTEGIAAVVENRIGAGSVIGTEAVSRAVPDGATLLINTPNIVIAAHLRKLAYDPLTSFEPICKLGSSPALVVVNNLSPYRTLADLVGAARGQPGTLTLASVGPATTLHIAAEKLKRATRADMIYVPFPGSGTAVSALLGGHVTAALAEYPAVSAQLDGGEFRVLATGLATRNGPLPTLPTIAESGYPGFEIDLWWGVFAPARTPRDIVSHLADVFGRAVETPDVKSKLAGIGFYPEVLCGERFASYLRQQHSEYGVLIRQANIRSE